MTKKLLLLSTILAAGLTSPAHAAAASLDSRIAALEQEIKILKRQSEIDKEEADKAAEKIAKVELGKKGLTVSSADGKAQFGLRGYGQLDGRLFLNDDGSTGKDEILARRLRPIITGKYDDFSFRLMPDFAGDTTRLFDAHADYKLDEAFQLRVGKFKPPIGLERLQSGAALTFIERGLPTNLAPNRDFGIQASGEFSSGVVDYQLGLFNGEPDLAINNSDDDDKKDYIARIFTRPFKGSGVYQLEGLGVGVAASTGDRDGTSSKTILGDYRSPGQQKIFAYSGSTFADGEHRHLYPQGYYYFGPLGVLAEYAVSEQNVSNGTVHDTLKHTAWQTVVSYVLTGEDASFDGVKPEAAFNPSEGSWGAFELAARIGSIDFDDKAFPLFASATSSVTDADSFGLGLNWHLNERVKWQVNYDHTSFTRGAATGDRPDEEVVFTRVQYQF